MYEMKPEYYTGIETIDNQHQKLFEIANRAYELLTNQFIPDKYDYILQVIEELRDYTKYHFNYEEEYMQSIGYKRILSHKVFHSDFIDKLNNINLDQIDDNQKEALLDLMEFLNSWLVDHILKQDKLIAE